MISDNDQYLLIRIEHGFLSELIPNARQRFADNIIFGRDLARFDNVSTVSNWINSADASNTETPVLLSEITTLPPLLSSDIALSIFAVKLILFIIHI